MSTSVTALASYGSGPSAKTIDCLSRRRRRAARPAGAVVRGKRDGAAGRDRLAERDREYYDHNQWTKEELDELKKRGQPAIVINKIHDKVSLLCGMERKATHQPKGFPRTPKEDRGRRRNAGAALHLRRQQLRHRPLAVFENMLVEGAGGAELGLEDDGKGGANITITHVPWDRIWYDPHSRRWTSPTRATRAWSSGWIATSSRSCIPTPRCHRDDVQQRRLLLQRPAQTPLLDRQPPPARARRAMPLGREAAPGGRRRSPSTAC